jgi:hypothetical protein
MIAKTTAPGRLTARSQVGSVSEGMSVGMKVSGHWVVGELISPEISLIFYHD